MSTIYTKCQSQELSVYGFIRLYAIAIIIPDELIQLCLGYFLDLMDSWNTELLCEGFKIEDNNKLRMNGMNGKVGIRPLDPIS